MGGGGDRVERRRRLLRDGLVGWVVLSRWARVTHGDRAQTLTSAIWPNGLHRALHTCVSLGCVRWVLQGRCFSGGG